MNPVGKTALGILFKNVLIGPRLLFGAMPYSNFLRFLNRNGKPLLSERHVFFMQVEWFNVSIILTSANSYHIFKELDFALAKILSLLPYSLLIF